MPSIALVLSVVPLLFQGDEEAAPALRWDRSLDAALAEAKRAKSFVLVVLPDDHEGEGHGALAGGFWWHKGLLKAAAGGRAVVGSPYKHIEHEGGRDRDGNTLERYCSRFGQLVCEQHREVEKQVVGRYFEGLEPAARPAFLILRGSDASVLARRVGDPTANELAETLRVTSTLVDGEGDPVVPSELLGRAQDSDKATRTRALRVLASLEFASADAARKKLLDDAKDDAARAELLLAIAECGSRTLRDVALSQLDSKSVPVRIAAARALGGPGLADGVDPLGKALAKARDDDERKWIVRSLGRPSRASESGKELLKKALADNKVLIRASAAVALGEACLGDPAIVKVLKQRGETDTDGKVRGACYYALATMRGADAKDVIAYLRQRKTKEKDPKASEFIAAAVNDLEGTLDGTLDWALHAFCGDPSE